MAATVMAMFDRSSTTDAAYPRPLDRALLGLEPHPDDPHAWSFLVTPALSRSDGRFYGGAALAAALAASEIATGRPALWSTTQLVATADQGERIVLAVDVVASGRSVDQVHVRGLVGERLVFNAVGATATPRDGAVAGIGQVMPAVPGPDDCEDWHGIMRSKVSRDGSPFAGEAPAVGHHLVSEYRAAPLLDPFADRPGHFALWARLTSDLVPAPTVMSPAAIGFVADMVPIAVCRACGVEGAGTSLDNSLRMGRPVETEWVLLELDAHVAVGGFGHGHVHVWSPDGEMLATGTQSAKLFSFSDFLDQLAR